MFLRLFTAATSTRPEVFALRAPSLIFRCYATSSKPDFMHGTGKLNIAFLECDQPVKDVRNKHGGYDDILHSLLEPELAKTNNKIKLETHGYDVVEKREYPSLRELEEIDCIVVSGSFVNDAAEDVPWVLKLLGFLLMIGDSYPRIRLIGICWGHQAISRAFSGQKIVPNPDGYEVGATKMKLTTAGKQILAGTTDTEEARDYMTIQNVHSDGVRDVPDGFELLGSTDMTSVAALCRFYPDGKDGPPFVHSNEKPPQSIYNRIQILTMQGHPEWNKDIITPLIDDFVSKGKLTKEAAKKAHERAALPDDGEEFGAVMLRTLGICPPNHPSLRDGDSQAQTNGH